MFTGIIQEIGQVQSLLKSKGLIKLGLESKQLFSSAKPSDSIAVNGACLTVVKKEKNILFFEAIPSTLKMTNIKSLKRGDFVNLESALKIGDELGGHFVLGHVDSELKLRKIIKFSGYWTLEIESPISYKKYILANGSIAIEGISLSIKKVLARSFTVDVIGYTYNNTNLKYKKVGGLLNVEFDYLLKKS
tara:strand:+ start:315 stop:884 length:570 start_codon:yes stop_codon:yes gene_type:complete